MELNLKLILICILFFISISSVCASDIDNVTAADNPNVDVCDNATFTDLKNDINSLNPGDVYNIDKDYTFKYTSPYENGPKIIYGQEGVEINVDNLTINGNGHVIDGNFQSALFKVTGNNIKIFNLTFINSKYEGWHIPVMGKDFQSSKAATYITDMSPVYWLGDNGLISECVFTENIAINGGAITWMGNNGVINNSVFYDNIARGVGGAIYIGGSNNTVCNSIFVNSISMMSGEAIYFDFKRENITLKNNAYKGNILFIDGKKFNVDVKRFLGYNYMVHVADVSVDLVPLIYHVITNGGSNYLDDDFMYYGEYNKNQEFILHLTRFFDDVSFTKNYKFTNLLDNSNIFHNLVEENFTTSLTLVKTISIYSNHLLNFDYRDAITTSTLDCFDTVFSYLENFDNCWPDLNLIRHKIHSHFKNVPVTFGLNINFKEALQLNCKKSLNITNCGFDVININGNGSKIYTKSKVTDENKWAIVGQNQILSVSNLTIEGYNTVVENFLGNCIFNSVVFNNNKMDYFIYRDYGAAIISTGVVVCKDCIFTNNSAKYGGAIFNQGVITLEKCHFSNNAAYGKIGNNVCNGLKGVAIVNNELIKHDNDIIEFSNKEATQNFLAKLYDCAKGSYLYKFMHGLLHPGDDEDDDFDIDSLGNDGNINFEGFKVMSRIFNERNTLT